MTVDDAENRLKSALAQLAETQVQDCLLTTLDMIAFVKLRLAEDGGRADGSDFTFYSVKHSITRTNKGLQIAYKDFNMTGQLYASIKPEVKAVSLGVVEVDIIPRGIDNNDKVRGQLKRDGNILYPTEAEIDDAIQAHTQRRVAQFKKLFS